MRPSSKQSSIPNCIFPMTLTIRGCVRRNGNSCQRIAAINICKFCPEKRANCRSINSRNNIFRHGQCRWRNGSITATGWRIVNTSQSDGLINRNRLMTAGTLPVTSVRIGIAIIKRPCQRYICCCSRSKRLTTVGVSNLLHNGLHLSFCYAISKGKL